MDNQFTGVPEWFTLDFKHMENGLNGATQGAFHQIRQSAFSRFVALGFPTPKLEDWKYTNVAPIARTPFRLAKEEKSSKALCADLKEALHQGVGETRLVFINGYFSELLSSVLDAQQRVGVRIGSLRSVFSADSADDQAKELVEKHLAKHASFSEQAFVAFNTAFVADGAYLLLPRGAVLDAPVEFVFLNTGNQVNVVSHPRVFVLADQDSQATIVETYLGFKGNTYFTSAVTEVVLGQNAMVDHYRVQREGVGAYHVSTTEVTQERDSSFRTHSFSFGGLLVRNEVKPTLNGQGAETTLNGLSVLSGKQHVDNHTLINHAEPHCQSNEWYKGIYAEQSRGVFCGSIVVQPDAQKTNAVQSNQALLLSEQASIDTKPQLKIWADDVKCTHGATVGQLDQDALYYLRTRGVGEQVARKILIRAFAGDIIEQVRPEGLRDHLYKLIDSRLAEVTTK
jgi:Fe-S cluster assembly protein SufD